MQNIFILSCLVAYMKNEKLFLVFKTAKYMHSHPINHRQSPKNQDGKTKMATTATQKPKPLRLELTTQNPNPPRSDQINSTNHQKFQIKRLNPWTKINRVAWFVKFLPIHGWSTPICWICTRDKQTHGIRNHLTQGPVICNIDRTKSLMAATPSNNEVATTTHGLS